MAYKQFEQDGLTTIELVCDARKGKRTCGNRASVSMQSQEAVAQFLMALGWRLLRRHQVCGSCMAKGVGKVHFPRTITQEPPDADL